MTWITVWLHKYKGVAAGTAFKRKGYRCKYIAIFGGLVDLHQVACHFWISFLLESTGNLLQLYILYRYIQYI